MKGPLTRVYTYTDELGNVFWSLTELPSTVSQGKRLLLRSRKGTIVTLFLAKLREEALKRLKEWNTSAEEGDI